MELKALHCPSCGASVSLQAGQKLVKCPYCDTTISTGYGEQERQAGSGVQFTDQKTGLPLAKAVIPEGWNTQGFLFDQQIDDITPFATVINTYNQDQTMQLTSRSGERWMQLLTKSMLSMSTPKTIQKKYLDPQEYLVEYASRTLGIPITPKSFGTISTRYSQNRSTEAQRIIGRFNENARIILPSVQCDFRLQNVLCEAYAVIGRYQKDGREYSLIMGGDLYGLEYYDASPMAALGRGITNGIGKLLGGQSGSAPQNPGAGFGNVFNETMKAMKDGNESMFSMDFLRGGGLVGAMKRQKERMANEQAASQMNAQPQPPAQPQAARTPDGKPAFGHAREAGQPVDAIEWGAKRIYYAAGPAEQEEDLIRKFMLFAGSYQMDQGLEQRLEQVHQQVRQQEQMSLQNATGYAMAAQQANMQRQAQISQTLQQSSNIVMQGWENRQAAQSRMSDNFSQAIRGVDSYTTTDGRTVEHSVASDHVYENRYGDTVGISGTGLSEQAMNDLGLTELNKK